MILPNEIANVEVKFVPTKSEKCQGQLRISVENNPYETVEVDLLGEGFTKPVIIDNLEIVDASLTKLKSKTSLQEPTRKARKSSRKESNSLSRKFEEIPT